MDNWNHGNRIHRYGVLLYKHMHGTTWLRTLKKQRTDCIETYMHRDTGAMHFNAWLGGKSIPFSDIEDDPGCLKWTTVTLHFTNSTPWLYITPFLQYDDPKEKKNCGQHCYIITVWTENVIALTFSNLCWNKTYLRNGVIIDMPWHNNNNALVTTYHSCPQHTICCLVAYVVNNCPECS